MYWLPRRKVLVPTDFTEASIDAIHTALAMVEYGHCVHSLHVAEAIPADLVAESQQGANLEEVEANRLQVCQQRLAAFLESHELNGHCHVVCSGDPALSITQYAKENDIDLIIMAAHSHQSNGQTSMGTVPERVLHNAECSVLVLRPDVCGADRSAQARIRKSKGFSAVETPSHLVSASQIENE